MSGTADRNVARTLTKVLVTLGALSVLVARQVWPSLKIDAVAVTLLVLTAVPWLDTIFKSLQTPFGGVEYQQRIEKQLQDLSGAAESALHIAETNEARDLAREGADRVPPATIAELATVYQEMRRSMASGAARTNELTRVVGRMIAALEQGADLDVAEFLKDPVGGRRLAAYVRLYVTPDAAFLLPLAAATVDEEQAFGQYWALRALSRATEAFPELMDRNTLRMLQRLMEDLPAGDRRYELGRLLARFDR